MKGNIFNIQKFSIHDGPGVRTTVFLKGCPLHCKWCANPESQSTDIQITYDARKCHHCLCCVKSCPQRAISHEQNGNAAAINIDHAKCVGCQTCVKNCLPKALNAEGEMMDIEKVVFTCLQDVDFYEESGGGVTLSGGECMCQPDFTEELIKELKKHNIHVAAETTGYIEKEIFQRVAPLFDLLLFDVKHYDKEKHMEGTGVSNELIIENLTWAKGKNISILPRIPVIPKFNSEIPDGEGIAKLLVKIGFTEAQLLPFHQFGERKYELLGAPYAFKDVKALYPENLADYQNTFIKQGINAYF
jgi:pyruvate formate lyase activating enzyme